jgi:hypothetical protein
LIDAITFRKTFMIAIATPEDLFEMLKLAWSRESSSKWSAENPAKGQCAVTSLVVQDLFGGSILKTLTRGGMHFYNKIDGVRWDLTISQFDYPIPFEDRPSNRDEAIADTTPAHYEALKARLPASARPG